MGGRGRTPGNHPTPLGSQGGTLRPKALRHRLVRLLSQQTGDPGGQGTQDPLRNLKIDTLVERPRWQSIAQQRTPPLYRFGHQGPPNVYK
ncbi:hypothetical protein FRAAL6418 [Frankia alni ACN14a]|uniref:Uncharacterized protein n=1 Tax=Frankia alni (strain DSM 45986 / CECT 9034 / ACN14a) TaxID=326424 RepID=Q0RBY9_FRAAA|nr:hypothetical protein FRAAL6418 [Frankia alni ACN14a]